jgi:hypothetical protein
MLCLGKYIVFSTDYFLLSMPDPYFHKITVFPFPGVVDCTKKGPDWLPSHVTDKLTYNANSYVALLDLAMPAVSDRKNLPEPCL